MTEPMDPEMMVFLKGHEVEFDWKDMLHETRVHISIPDLRRSKYSVWGDWGPMYSLEVDAHQPLKMKYIDIRSGMEDEYALELHKIELNSPTIADDRIRCPYYYVVPDALKGFRYELFLSSSGDVWKIEVFRMSDGISLWKSAEGKI